MKLGREEERIPFWFLRDAMSESYFKGINRVLWILVFKSTCNMLAWRRRKKNALVDMNHV